MLQDKPLYEQLETQLGRRPIIEKSVPDYITGNLKHPLFEWQANAIKYFLAYSDPANGFFKSPTHLMFNMATGSGKTLLMAALLLYYYKKHGMRHFLFFVNRRNIVDKTEHNFLDSTHAKYLFTEKIVIDDDSVPLHKVDVFSDDSQGIEVKFASIQKLYNDIHIEKENQTTLDDLHRKNIVMLADEAHHLNTRTKQQTEMDMTTLKNNTSAEEIERKGWEHTVLDFILQKNNQDVDNKNVLLEFTATIPSDEWVQKKYSDKIIYKFDLKEFLRKGYTKEINLVSSTLEKKQRIFQALLFHWYRCRIALDNGIANFKPVILFRSKTIAESKKDHEEFVRWVEDVVAADFDFLDDLSNWSQSSSFYEQGEKYTDRVLSYMKHEKISRAELANFIKKNFVERNVMITNSGTNTAKTKEKTDEDQDKLLNSLEDKDNHIRAIFTVERLTEGWDVLNLFDIVRLYQGQNAGGNTKKTPVATVSEVQLIGRGVRYFPFDYGDHHPQKRKFDNDLDNNLRVLEELFYYTYDEESKYISHLKATLRRDGFIQDNKQTTLFDLKQEFKDTTYYKNGKLWANSLEQNTASKREQEWKDARKKLKDFEHIIRAPRTEHTTGINKTGEIQQATSRAFLAKIKSLKIKSIEKHIFYKALNKKAAHREDSIYRFENFRKKFKVDSIEHLQDKLLDWPINVIVEDPVVLNNQHHLDICFKFLGVLETELKKQIPNQKGGEFSAIKLSDVFDQPKIKTTHVDSNSNSDEVKESTLNYAQYDWFVSNQFVGTSEETSFLKFFEYFIEGLKEKYNKVYLLRNEEVYKIYDYEQGRGFQPDFLLFLINKDPDTKDKNLYYQVFIEPKGDQFKDKDGNFTLSKEGWKEKFLAEISKKYDGEKPILELENKQYRLLGLPFYNKGKPEKFKKAFNKLLPNPKSDAS